MYAIKNSFFLLALIFTLAKSQRVLEINPGAKISVVEDGKLDYFGIVKGVRSCGGLAKVIQWRYETCLSTDPICHVPSDGNTRKSHVDFIPFNEIKKPALRLIVKSNDRVVNYVADDGAITSEPVIANGSTYTVTATAGANEELKGKATTFQYILYDLSDERIQFCIETDVQFD